MRILVICMAIVILASIGYAHPPKKMDVNIEDKQIEVVVYHPVGNTKLHLIDKIDVYVNGKKRIKQTYITQGESEQKAVYIIPGLKTEDVVKVKASCNKYGGLSKSITIE